MANPNGLNPSYDGSVQVGASTAPADGGTRGLGLLMSSTSELGIFFGSGAPTLNAAKGSIYVRTNGSTTSDRLYVNTSGTAAWTNVTTAA